MSNDFISFSARFNGVAEQIFVPVASMLAIYARENGEGMMFPSEDSTDSADNNAVDGATAKSTGPILKIIK
jgi:stringent starvation protein B